MNRDLLVVPKDRAFLSIEAAKKSLAMAITLLGAKQVKDVAEAMRVWARAQKDGQGAAQDAAEIVLRAERRLGELAREMPKAPGPGRGNKSAPRTSFVDQAPTKSAALADLGISRQRAQEYEKIAGIPADQFEASVRLAREEQREITTAGALRLAGGGKLANFSSESVEWYTPKRYVDAARLALGGFDLDPASSEKANATVAAKRFFTQKDDGLAQDWCGRIWLNPPYGDSDTGGTGAWVDKLVAEVASGRATAAIILVNAVTDRKWFQPLWGAAALCFTDHRIEFYTPSGQPKSPVSGNVFAYWGDDAKRFRDTFVTIGPTVRMMR